LTTKMLASTVQFSTNNHPNTRPCIHLTPPRAGMNTRAQMTVQNKQRLFFQDPTGCLTLLPAAPNPPLSDPERSYTCARRPLPKKSSPVSPPLSTPPPHSGSAGSCPFSREGAP